MPNRTLLIALLAAALALRLALVFALPYGAETRYGLEGLNDEPSHWNYVRYVAEHQRLPVQASSTDDADAFVRNEYEYYQPPLYYLACVPLYELLGERGGWIAARLLSFACAALTLLVIYRLLIAVGLPVTVAMSGCLFVAFLPSHAYFGSVASNDAASWLLAQLALLSLMRMLASDEPQRRDGILLAVWLSLGLWTKGSGALPIVLVACAALAHAIHTRSARTSAALMGATVFGVAMAAPWYLRNISLYGSALAVDIGFGPAQPWIDSPGDFLHLLRSTIRFFWFPMQHVPDAGGAKLVEGLIAIATLGVGAAFVAWVARRRDWSIAETLLFASLLLAIVAHLRLNWLWFNPEGRYLFPALGAIAFCVAAPLARALQNRSPIALPLICVALAIHPYLYLFTLTG